MNVIYLFQNKTGTGDSPVVNILGPSMENLPPVLQVHLSSTATWALLASHDGLVWNTALSGQTISRLVDLIPGIALWKLSLSENAGLVNVLIGPVMGANGRLFLPRIMADGHSALD